MPVVQHNPPTRTANALTEAVAQHVEHFQRRVIQDALTDATAAYWRRRAAAFEDARPRAGDWSGAATEVELRAADQRCLETAEACRLRAQWSLVQNRDEAAA